MIRIIIALIYSALLIVTMPAYSQLYFFGDSLSDGGVMDNNSVIKNLPGDRKAIYTNPGRENYNVWPYYVAKAHGQENNYGPNNNPLGNDHKDGSTVSGELNGNNYAAGGAVTHGKGVAFTGYQPPSLVVQIDRFKAQHQHDANLAENTYFIWVGANDFSTMFLPYISNPGSFDLEKLGKQLKTVEEDSPKFIGEQISRLQAMGAKKIYVLLVPHLSNTPLVQQLLTSVGLNNIITRMMIDALSTNPFNSRLKAIISTLNQSSSTKIKIFDPNKTMDEVISSLNGNTKQYSKTLRYVLAGETIKLTDYKTPACLHASQGGLSLASQSIGCENFAANANELMFADIIHPSASTHLLLADFIVQDLTENPWQTN